MKEQFDRNVRFFGDEGQKIISEILVCVAGLGGLGSHVVQQLSHLGVTRFILIDNERLDITNLNRYVGATLIDALTKIRKVDLAERIILSINPDAEIIKVHGNAISKKSLIEAKKSDFIFGCFDNDGARFVMNEFSCAHEIPYIDIASDIHVEGEMVYGGRVAAVVDNSACLLCMGELDNEEVQNILNDGDIEKLKNEIYGVDIKLLDEKGPSVVSINGVVSSLAVTEFMVHVTKLRPSKKYITYRGDEGKTTVRNERVSKDCFCCENIRGAGDKVNIEKYFKKD